MARLVKLLLMTGSLLFVVAGVVALRRELDVVSPGEPQLLGSPSAPQRLGSADRSPADHSKVLQAKAHVPVEGSGWRTDGELSPAISAFEPADGWPAAAVVEPLAADSDTASHPPQESVPPRELAPQLRSAGSELPLAADAPVPPEEPSPTTYCTVADDSLWRVSLKCYGTGEYFKALFALNRVRIRYPDRIEAGIVLDTPLKEELRRRFPELCPTELSASPAAGEELSDEARLVP